MYHYPKGNTTINIFSAYGSIISHINGSITLEYSRESGALHHGLFIH